jgi:hypothetical protein
MASDLPDYTRLVAVNVEIPDVQIGPVKVGEYKASPADLPDGTKTLLLTDVKGRAVVVQYEKDRTVTNVVEINHSKIKGVALKDPTYSECIPTSIENDALAYDAANDRFKVDIKAVTATGDLATETTLASIDGKIPSDPAKESGKLTDINTTLGNIKTDVDKIPSDPAKESGKLTDINTTLGNIKTDVDKIPTDPAKESGKLTDINTALGNIKTDVDKIPTDPAKESGKLTDINTTLGNIKTDVDKIPSDPAKESGKLTNIDTTLTAIKSTDGIKKITDDVDVKTSGGTNIIIDCLTQAACVARNVTISNAGTASGWSDLSGNIREGKFFPRGCRGFLRYISVYCKDTGSSGGTLTIWIAPHPNSGYIYTGTIAVPAGQTETTLYLNVSKMWNFDSMFIYVGSSSAQVVVAYDSTAPVDMLHSTDAGVTWAVYDRRLFVAAFMRCLTVGDVPVSGAVSLNDRSAYEYKHCTADTQIKASAGRLHTVTINTVTTGGVLTIYDNTAESGTVIAAITLAANDKPVTLTYDVLCKTGIYAGFDGTLAADITISYI